MTMVSGSLYLQLQWRASYVSCGNLFTISLSVPLCDCLIGLFRDCILSLHYLVIGEDFWIHVLFTMIVCCKCILVESLFIFPIETRWESHKIDLEPGWYFEFGGARALRSSS